MSDELHTKPEPETFADLANQPSGSGVEAEQVAFMKATLEGAAADASLDAGIADESAAYTRAMSPTEDGPGEAESEAQPS
ncbi:hypothetical protein U1701_03480 [Sphingomonas sp. PB2P19]|uniref:hypothetical protein n=1 Tax=Sphingomonas rhamnosi TaxID=3096156 RepID=UPI002FC636B1